MDLVSPPLISAVAFGVAIGAMTFALRRQNGAGTRPLVDVLLEKVGELQSQNADLERKIDALTVENHALRMSVERLGKRLGELGVTIP